MSTAVPLMLCLVTGCATTGQGFIPPWKKDASKTEAPRESLSLTGKGLLREPIDPKSREELDAAQQLLQDKKYAEAEKLFDKMAQTEGSKWADFNPFNIGEKKRPLHALGVYEEALFYRAECQRLQKNYRDAEESYTKLLMDIPQSRYVQRSCQGLWEIADHWLEPTRRQMDEYQDQLQGKRWFVTPASYFNVSKELPWMDAEGRAVNVLNTIRAHDINGPMGERALFCLGTINFFRKEYKEADFYFTELYKRYPNSKEAHKAVRQSIICKQLMTGGTVYDLRTVEESKKLLMIAQASYQELARDEKWVESQLKSINIQQADRDFKIAEFYQRTGHPGSAYFYYELVCRRYPGTTYATQAAQRKDELRSKAGQEAPPQERPPTPAPTMEPTYRPGMPLMAPPRVLPPGMEK